MSRLGNFSSLSTALQLGNIASEVTRARVWHEAGNAVQYRDSLGRALELVGLFLSGRLPHALCREMARLEEVLAQFYVDEKAFSVTLDELESYLLSLFLVMRR